MDEEFIPYLDQIMPTLLKIASLNEEYRAVDKENLIADGMEDFDLVSAEVDERNAALEMIKAFVTELKAGFSAYAEPTGQILLPMLTFRHSEFIRSLSAECIQGLMICVVEGRPEDRDFQVKHAQQYLDELWKASGDETETEVLGVQCRAIRDIIKDMQTPFMSEEVVNTICRK